MIDRDELDFQKIYTAYHPRITRYLTSLVGLEEADDLAQEVFLKASQSLAGFRGEASLSTWLYRIATNLANDRLRNRAFRLTLQRSRCADPDREAANDIDEASDGGSCNSEKAVPVEQELVKQEMSECIHHHIDRLPESYRAILLLSDLEELSNKRIAAILGVTLDTVKIRLHRARARLKEELESQCEYYWVSELSWPAS